MSIPFADRHNGPRTGEIDEMLNEIGVKSLDELVKQTVPADILLKSPLKTDKALSEYEYLAKLKGTASKNKNYRSLIGLGFYGTGVLPAVVRNIFENPSWYTSYTPYQAEISQGRLEALLNFQTMVASLTGFKMANSSMLDDSTAAAEAVRMMYELRSREAQKAGKNLLFIDSNTFPQVIAVIETRAEVLGIEIIKGEFNKFEFDDRCFGAVLQYPAANGAVEDYSSFCETAHSKGILVTAVTDLLALCLLKEPAAWGADIAVGTAQRFGLPMGFGGPTAGFMATRDEYKRNMPGRIIGVSVDRLGKPALRMALQTREQHIKREKATSNICTATALMASMTGMYAVYHGPHGLRSIAARVHAYAKSVAGELTKNGFKLITDKFFDTIQVTGVDADAIKAAALNHGFNFYYPNSKTVQMSFDELTNCEEAVKILSFFGISIKECPGAPAGEIFLARENEYLTEATFNKFHSETELMRYIKKLERRDISLTHSMIPLGSCTMKLNAAVEMMPLSWSELTNMHPFVPADQAEGYMQIIKEVEQDLAEITGFDACSLQPNSGAAGEYAGLMTIRAYHLSKGDTHRNVAIIPTSAHGTNPASAAMAGMEIILVSCDQMGNINVDELRQKAQENKERLSCIMITYPSTHGVFEVKIREIMDIIHENGGLVYMDGANMNAQVGLTNPGFIGADVCHLNLHKTFAIPHGGGGPGIGPICVTKELAQFLPCHPFMENCTTKGARAISSAPYGYPMALPITHAYIKLLGPDGLKRASELAILNANYVSVKLKDHFKTLYTGSTGRVAHECILDLRDFAKEYGVDATDVAKRLMDYGFHAPTLSFPVAGTLMVEPTESEPKAELDRFIEAMISIKAECEAVKAGILDKDDNPLKNAPHTAGEVTANEWNHKYEREMAAFPLEWIRDNKFWPHVARVDNGYGDRNLMCSCEGWL
ncbi:MAG: glycine dehydrogenase (aminomethyl-transferring) [Bacteroidetes bacterium GWE2_39_28]|nr:MAG: glycine dehydrogenase (aminomethyl-transferring) [Bacteroidetes bacterium GWE2_39_28]OFY11857.1 MAG: glycine dehydrogenase (aminomethyl-transferring) [Bacteroidetes bacterium GWF2_39_10]OFZ09421.1 MAG: glycine dehydrogenase (aminomethyl-transferring) [Bacteroidetes bacterium RIFOXYB2_FULL_39_7]OFZ11344.1 MAG: glycine dehydrogenase (aminomethyl-transferring) [Bacteroidetes bacterium RIFOXYC2_FULL_39_11]HCT95204.1 glycine dehydrogenase (aminomethyl-transferring) [Rikenellaceae bacterium]